MRRALAAAAACMIAASAFAENGRTGAATLSRTTAAGPAALGNAHGAADGRLDGVFQNPANAATLPAPEIQATYLRGLVDDSLSGLRYGHPLSFGTGYVGVDYFDAGTIDVNLSNGIRENRRAQQDMVGVLGFAAGRELPLSVGAALKVYKFELAEEASASGVAFDAGALWRTPLQGFSIGAAVANAGPSVEFEEESDPLPLAARAGIAYDVDFANFNRFRDSAYGAAVFIDGVSRRREDAAVSAGLELRRAITAMERAGSVALRGGYMSEPEAFTAGLGIRFAGFGLDYALNLVDDLDESHRATLSWRFMSRAEALAAGAEPTPTRRRLAEPD